MVCKQELKINLNDKFFDLLQPNAYRDSEWIIKQNKTKYKPRRVDLTINQYICI